jgi:hypothetical protein
MKLDIGRHVASPEVEKLSGVHATFCKLDDKWGVKFFGYKNERDMNYELMEKLADANVACDIGPKVEFDYCGEKYFGFLIEICEPAENAILAYFGVTPSERRGRDYCSMVCTDGKKYKEFMAEHPDMQSAYDDLLNRCDEAGFDWGDSHAGNWGFNSEGEAVLFDVSCEAECALDYGSQCSW